MKRLKDLLGVHGARMELGDRTGTALELLEMESLNDDTQSDTDDDDNDDDKHKTIQDVRFQVLKSQIFEILRYCNGNESLCSNINPIEIEFNHNKSLFMERNGFSYFCEF